MDKPTVAYEDNTASITLSSNLGTPHKKSKHFGIEWSFFKESVEFGEITPIFVPTNQQPADMLTKSLVSNKFVEFRDMVMGDSILQNFFTSSPMVTHFCVKVPIQPPVESQVVSNLDVGLPL